MTFRIVDTETTGLEKTDEVVELAAIDFTPTMPTIVIANDLVRPSKPIPPEATAIHHITNAMVRNAPLWNDLWPRYFRESSLRGVKAIVGHKVDFDAQWITPEIRCGLPLICTWKCALRRWPDAKSHSNQALRYFLGLVLGEEAMPPHRALPDTFVTAAILSELLEDCTPEQLITWSAEPPLMPTCPISEEWRGKKWELIDDGFLNWCLTKKDMDPDIIWNVKHEQSRRKQAAADATAAKREAYTAAAVALVNQAVTVEDLRCWFAWEADARAGLGIYPDTQQYARIVAACTDKTTTLPLAIPRPAPEAAHAQS